MRGYKSPASRLARMFKQSREKWKKRAQQRQQQKRALQVRVRDLKHSREQWKAKAQMWQQEVQQLKAAANTMSDMREVANMTEGVAAYVESDTKVWAAPAGHVYPVPVIQLAIEQIMHSLNSLRGCAKTFDLFAQFFALSTPSFSSVRQWVFRLGLYQLRQTPERRADWIVILDLTIELGAAKCLVILGIPAADLKETGYALGHQDVTVLAIVVLTRSTGEIIAQELAQVSEKVGVPCQILADHGSDVKKGIELYQQEHPQVIYTYDVTHQMALFLKQELADDERFQSFLSRCHRTRQQVQQTPLYFLSPPKQRHKARYMNIDTQIHWAQQVLAYQQQGDFSQIEAGFAWDEQARAALKEHPDAPALAALAKMDKKIYPDKLTFLQALRSQTAPGIPTCTEEKVCLVADVGRRQFQAKLGWLADYQADIAVYAQMVDLAHQVEKQVKRQGLSRTSAAIFARNTETLDLKLRARQFKDKIDAYLTAEGQQIPEKQTLLATSDVVESIFGKYKLFSANRPLKEMGKTLLTIPILTARITGDLVKRAMESVRTKDVDNWAQKLFGQSMLSKRRSLSGPQMATKKLHEEFW